MMKPGWQYATDPTWLPFNYHRGADQLMFARVPRELRQECVFLDPRYVPARTMSPGIPVTDIPSEEARRQAGPLHFIFHSAYCCSTLLARALDIPGVSASLREPAVLTYLSGHIASGRPFAHADFMLSLSLDLLSRPLVPGEAQIVKPSNASNHILPRLMEAREDARAIIIYSDLASHLRATARRGEAGTQYAMELWQHFIRPIPLDLPMEDMESWGRTGLQVAAICWLMQINAFAELARRLGDQRVRVVNAETFLARKAEVLGAATRFFGLNVDENMVAQIAGGRVFAEHAKRPTAVFNTESYRLQDTQVSAAHASEIEAILAWARDLAQRANVPLRLSETLAN